MGLSVGDVTFGLGVETKGLTKAVGVLKNFGAQIDALAQKQDRASKKTTAALAKQEAAAIAALRRVVQLREGLLKAGAPPEQLAAATNAFKTFNNQMVRGVQTTTEMNRAQAKLDIRLNKLGAGLKGVGSEQAARKGAKFTRFVRDLESASVLAVGPLSGLGARIRALGSIFSRSTIAMVGWLAGITGAVIGTVKLVKGAINAARAFQKIDAVLTASTGSAVLARKEFQFVSDVSDRLGLSIAKTAEQYAQLVAASRGTVLAGEQIRLVFLGVATAASALKLGGEAVTGTIRALVQMISKGTVQAEELRGQFGERIPGGFKLAAVAMGVTTKALGDLLKKGEVIAEDLLPKLAKLMLDLFAGPAKKSAQSLDAAFARLENSVFKFNLELDRALGLSNSLKGLTDSLAASINFLKENLDIVFIVLGAVLGGLVALFSKAIIAGLTFLAGLLLKLSVFAVPFGLAALPALLVAIGIVAAGAAIGALAMAAAMKKVGDNNAQATEDTEAFILATKKAGGALRDTRDEFVKLTETRIVGLRAAAEEAQRVVDSVQQGGTGVGLADMLFGGPEKAPAKDVETLRVALVALKTAFAQLAALRGVSILPPEIKDGGFKDAEKDVNELMDRFLQLTEVMSELAIGSEGAAADVNKMFDALNEAKEITEGLSEAAKTRLIVVLKAMHFEGKNATAAVQQLILALQQMEDVVKDGLDSAEKLPKALKEATKAIIDLQRRAAALRGGPTIFEAFEKAEKIDVQVKKFTEALKEAGVEQARLVQLTLDYRKALEDVGKAQEVFDEIEKGIKLVEKGIDRAFDRIGSAITDALLKGEKAFESFAALANSILSELFQTLFEFTLIDPLKGIAKEFLGGFLSPSTVPTTTLGGSAGDFGAKGLAILNGSVQKLARGGIINRPTLLAGGAAIGGEKGGKSEGVLPLVRTSGGDLGVNASGLGGGTSVEINIINNAGVGIKTQQGQTAQGGLRLDVILDKTISDSIRGGGQTFRAIRDVFLTNTRTVGR